MKRFLSILLCCLFAGVFALGEQVPKTAVPDATEGLQFSVGYLYQGSQPTFGGSWFGLNGGRADVTLPLNRHVGLVAELSGVHTENIPSSNTGLTLVTYMAGPRVSMPLHLRREAGKVVPFAQALFGGVHGTDGSFPAHSTMSSSANAFAMSMGGGLQVGLSRTLSLRLVQAEYLYTRLPNLFDNYQNNYRIGAGVVLRLP
jgi:outer membrane immunogenic protein